MFPSQTLALTGKIPRRCSRSWLPPSQRGDRFAMARRAFLLLSRSLTFETRHWDGTALPALNCNIDDHIPYVRPCTNSKVWHHIFHRICRVCRLVQLRALQHCGLSNSIRKQHHKHVGPSQFTPTQDPASLTQHHGYSPPWDFGSHKAVMPFWTIGYPEPYPVITCRTPRFSKDPFDPRGAPHILCPCPHLSSVR